MSQPAVRRSRSEGAKRDRDDGAEGLMQELRELRAHLKATMARQEEDRQQHEKYHQQYEKDRQQHEKDRQQHEKDRQQLEGRIDELNQQLEARDKCHAIDWFQMVEPLYEVPTAHQLKQVLAQPLVAPLPLPPLSADHAGWRIPERHRCNFKLVAGGLYGNDNLTVVSLVNAEMTILEGTENARQTHVDSGLVTPLKLMMEARYSERVPKRRRLDCQRNSANCDAVSTQDDDTKVNTLRPDFYALVDGEVVFVGEEKAVNFDAAVADLKTKFFYKKGQLGGDLHYLMAYASAGTHVQFYAIREEGEMVPATDKFNLAVEEDRYDFAVAMVNLARLLPAVRRLVPEENGLPQTWPRKHGVVVHRLFRGVEKTVAYDGASWYDRANFERFYATFYSTGKAPCEQMPDITATFEQQKMRLSVTPLLQYMAEAPSKPADLVQLARHTLLALHQLHAKGWCHRDVRLPNVMRWPDAPDKFCLIDYEMAAPSGTATQWQPTLEPSCKSFKESWQPHHDLQQLGKFLVRCVDDNDDLLDFCLAMRRAKPGTTAATFLAQLPEVK